MKGSLKKFGQINVVALLFFALLFPGVLDYTKIAFFLGFLLSILLFLVLGGWQKPLVNRDVFILLCFILGLNAFFVLWGMLNGANNESVMESLRVYILYPLFYVFFIAALPQVLSIRILSAVLLAISITTSYIVIAHVFRIGGIIIPGYELLYLLYPELTEAINTHAFSGEVGYTPRVMERLIFFGPFAVALLVIKKLTGLSRFIVWANLLLIIMATFVSERRAMVVILLLAAMGISARWVFTQPKRVVAVCMIGVGMVAVMIALFVGGATGISTEDNGYTQDLTRIVESYTEGTLTIRHNQVQVLVTAAEGSPLLGVGFGNSISGYARDPAHPWRFELTYVALLFQTGILGVLLYTIVFIYLVVIAINSFKKSGDIILPYIFGLAGGLIAVATNPYMSYGTGQWILFLPLAAFNYVLLAKDRKVTVEHRLANRDVRTVD